MENWLVIGGAGYIGAHIARNLIRNGDKVLILDNFSTGKKSRILGVCEYVDSDCRSLDELKKVLNDNQITGVIHLAANKHARESVLDPEKYWNNNVVSMLTLMQATKGSSVKKIVLSSSCSVYGSNSNPKESDPRSPISPYGRTKMACEDILQDFCAQQSIQWAILRYFNVIGCDQFLNAADDSDECLVPVITQKIRDSLPVTIFGSDFDTPDGTAIRDYIDVRDLANAHVVVANNMQTRLSNILVNVSTGKPTSVSTIIKTFENVSGRRLDVQIKARNHADPGAIWSMPSHELRQFGWKPQYEIIDSIRAHWINSRQ
jgi:UDP-glucose 4-epimerase